MRIPPVTVPPVTGQPVPPCVLPGAPRATPADNPPRMVCVSWAGSQLRCPVAFTPSCRLLGLHCALGLAIRDRVWRNVVGCHFCEEVTKTPASISSTLLPPLICSLCWKQTPCYQLPVERPAWQGTGGGLQPMASRELSPSVQQPAGSRVLPAPREFENGSVIGLRMRPRPRLTLRLQPVTDPEAGAPS